MWGCAVFIKNLLLHKILQSYTSALVTALVHKTAMLVLSIIGNFLFVFVVHFTTLSMSVLYNGRMSFLMINWKRFGRIWLQLNQGIIPEFAWRDWGDPCKTLVTTGDVLAEIQTEHLLDRSLKHCCYTRWLCNNRELKSRNVGWFLENYIQSKFHEHLSVGSKYIRLWQTWRKCWTVTWTW
jgi:hypothetical protein